MASVVPFLGMQFLDADLEGIRGAIRKHLATPGFFYAVTPNVDHVVTYHGSADDDLRDAYDGAALQICDSRILSALARPSGRRLTPVPGSDLTRDILERGLDTDGAGAPSALRIAVIGPSQAAFGRLRRRYPKAALTFLPSGRMKPGHPAWAAAVEMTAKAEWDLILICLSFPKQEFFARDLRRHGRCHGFGLCVGASIDFLTGRQRRAPRAFQKVGLEWLHRLASDPKRMWRRYLVRGPAIFSLAARQYAQDARKHLRFSRSG